MRSAHHGPVGFRIHCECGHQAHAPTAYAADLQHADHAQQLVGVV